MFHIRRDDSSKLRFAKQNDRVPSAKLQEGKKVTGGGVPAGRGGCADRPGASSAA